MLNTTLPSTFHTFFIGGFECSSHRPRNGKRLDLIEATNHDIFACEDYTRLREVGIGTARDGIRWHLIEHQPYAYTFDSVLPMVRAARLTGVQIIWDLCHYGWPDDLDLLSPRFVERYAALAGAFARLLDGEGIDAPIYAPVNEISFFAWASGTVGYFYPYMEGKGYEVKAQLVRAAIAGIEAVWAVNPRARIMHPDPIINVVCHPDRPNEQESADGYTHSQFEAWDMLAGHTSPELGGKPEYLDIIGANYYPHNQWIWSELPFNPAFALRRYDPLYRPLRSILFDLWQRYERPVIIAETGADNDERAGWLRYVCEEVRAAINKGAQLEGICLYPVLNFPWWDDEVHLHNGLWDKADSRGQREIYRPLAEELEFQSVLFEEAVARNVKRET